MAKQFSLAPIITEQRPREDIADKVSKYLGVATQAVADFKEREELEKTQLVSKRLFDEKDAYRKRIEQAATSEEMKEAYTIYTSNTEDAINNSGLSEKSVLRFRGLQDKTLDYMSNRYKATLDKEGEEAFKNATTDVATAFIDADPKTQKELYNEFLKVAPNFRIDKSKGAEIFTKALANSVIVSLGEDARFSQVNQAHKDLQEVIYSDPANKNKPYALNLDNTFNTLKNKFRAEELKALKTELGDPTLGFKWKLDILKRGKDEGILSDQQYGVEKNKVENRETEKTISNNRSLTGAKLQDFGNLTLEQARKLVNNKDNNYSDLEKEAILTNWEGHKTRFDIQVAIASNKEVKANTEKMRKEYQNLAYDYISAIKNGDYTSVPPKELEKAAKVGWEGKRLPLNVRSAIDKYERQYGIVNRILENGGDFNVVSPKDPELERMSPIKGVPQIDSKIAAYKTASSMEGVMEAYAYAQQARNSRYVVDRKHIENLRVAKILNSIEDPNVAFESFRTYLTGKVKVNKLDVEDTLVEVRKASWSDGNLTDMSPTHPINIDLRRITEITLKAGLADYSNISEFIKDSLDEDFIEIELPGIANDRAYLPKGSFTNKTVYDRTLARIEQRLPTGQIKDVNNQKIPKGEVMFIYPINFLNYKDGRGEVTWKLYMEDGSEYVIDNELVEGFK
jgi:hypothetical protein